MRRNGNNTNADAMNATYWHPQSRNGSNSAARSCFGGRPELQGRWCCGLGKTALRTAHACCGGLLTLGAPGTSATPYHRDRQQHRDLRGLRDLQQCRDRRGRGRRAYSGGSRPCSAGALRGTGGFATSRLASCNDSTREQYPCFVAERWAEFQRLPGRRVAGVCAPRAFVLWHCANKKARARDPLIMQTGHAAATDVELQGKMFRSARCWNVPPYETLPARQKKGGQQSSDKPHHVSRERTRAPCRFPQPMMVQAASRRP